MQFHGLNNFLLKTNTADRPLKHRVVKPRQPDPRGTSLGHHGGKKAELEKLLLSVKLDTDTSDVPLYSESYEPSVCLPSSGYKSDPENVRNRIRTCYSADEMSPDHSPVRKTTRNTYCDENRPSIRRTKSLNQFSVTDRVSEIKKRLQSSKTRPEENNPVGEILNLKIPSENYSLNISKKTEARIENKLSQYLSNKKLNVVSVKRARSFNIGDNNKLASSKSNLQSSTPETTRSNLDEFNQKCGKESKTNLTERRSRSFSSLQNAWEKREICSDNLAKNNELENDGLKQFCEKRRSRKLSWDRSDSETETEEIHLTKAALQRLERRSRNHIRNSDRFFQQKYSYDTNNNDINSNLSDKTLDSGIFDLAVNNLSQGIQQLSKQYNFEDYHIDDAVSLNSGYSSASDSIAESISTYYESPDDEFESKKKQLNKPIKQFNNSAKTGLPYLAFKFNKLAPTSKNNEKRLLTQEHSKKTPTKNLQMTVTDEELMTKTNNVTLAIRAKLNKNSISNAVENGRSVRKFMPQTLDNTHKTLLEKSNNSDVSKANVACWNKQKVAEEKKNSTKDVTTALKKVKENTENSHTDSGDRIKNFDLSKNKQLYDNQNKSAYPNSTESSHLKNSTEAEQTMNAKSADFIVSSSISNLSSHENNPVVKKIDGVQIKLAKTVIAPSLKSLLGVHKNDNKSNGLEVQLVNHKQIDYKNDDKTTNRDIFRVEQTDKFSVLSNNTLTKNLTSDKSDSDLKSKKNFVTRGDSLEVKINFSATQSTSIDTVSKKVLNSPNKHLAKPPLSPLKSPITLKSVGKEISSGPQIKETCEELLEEIKVETDTAIEQPNKKAEPLQTLNCYSNTLNNKSSSVNRGVQCSLLNDAISTKTLFTEVLVSDSTQKHFISKDIADDIGSDILQDIQFTFPQYLIPPGEEIDCTHFSEEFDSKQIQMENVRLQTVLLEVEKARMSSVKALLHVNNALNKVQNDNAQIESELKVCLHEKELLTESIDNANRNHHKIQINNEIIQDKEEFEKDSQDPADLSYNALSWKKEKVEYAAQVQKYKLEYENAEKDAIRLKSLYKKVKEQLEHSNNAFTITLKNNLEAAKRMEEQLQTCLAEKKQLVIKCNEGSKIAKELEKVKQELEELKNIQEEIEDEKDELEKKCKHLEKQKKQLLLEQEELHEQIGHSQEIIEKLTEAEEELEERLEKAIKDKEYLQECLEDNGQILYQMQHRQKALISDKDALSDILNAEVEEKETLQNTLQVRAEEQKELWDKLQDITKIHSTVTESLQQANKKEKNYQEQIEALTKTNHILHYSLEKEKEERSDLQEIFEVMEMEHKKFKMETVGKVRSMETKIEDLMMENSKLTQMKDELALKCDELQNSVADAEERNAALKEEINSVVQSKSTIDNELTNLRENAKETEKNIFETNQAYHNVEVNLKKEIEKTESLTHTLEETESALEDATKKLHETKTKLNETKADLDDLNKIAKERSQTIRELERNLEVSKEQRDKYLNRVHFYESETKELRKTINDQKDEIGTLKTDVQRISRERDANKRNYDMSVRDFEAHKIRCAENLKKLKEEILELSHKIIEKDRLHLKQKSQYQDQIDNTQHDLQFLKQILEEADLRKQQAMQKLHQEILNDDNFHEKMDFNFLRKSHDKFRDEFQSHVEKLEDILRDSKQSADSITVVQSPMSKIKLEELKQLRNEVYDLTLEVNKVKERLTQYSANISLLKVNIRSRSFNTTPDDFSSTEKNEKIFQFDSELSTLMDLMTKIECRHKGVMSRNVILLQRTLEKEDSISKELVKKLQVVSLEGENKQLKTLLGILKNKYNFDEHELATELKLVTDDSEILLNRVNCDLDDVISSSSTNKTFLSPNGENIASKRDTPTIRVNQNNSTSSKVSLYNSEDEDPIPPYLPKRSSSLRGRLRK